MRRQIISPCQKSSTNMLHRTINEGRTYSSRRKSGSQEEARATTNAIRLETPAIQKSSSSVSWSRKMSLLGLRTAHLPLGRVLMRWRDLAEKGGGDGFLALFAGGFEKAGVPTPPRSIVYQNYTSHDLAKWSESTPLRLEDSSSLHEAQIAAPQVKSIRAMSKVTANIDLTSF